MACIARKWAPVFVLAFIIVGVSASVRADAPRATTAQKRAASEGFSSCREQAREGDATACWKLWLKKHKEAGSEAEVAYAEEHAGAIVAPQASSVPPAKSLPKGHTSGRTESNAIQPASSASSAPSANRAPTSIEAPAASASVAASAQASVPEASEPAPVSPAAGQVFDFCALKPRADSTRFVKQRVVLFAMAGTEPIEGDGEIKKVDGAKLVREVFAARFPLDRFYNVAASFPGEAGWGKAESITVGKVEDAIAPAADSDSETKREREFVRYSVRCTDYLAVPVLESQEAKWEEKEVQDKKGNKRKVQALTVKLTGAVSIFRREGSQFKLVQTVRASVPGMMDFATDAVAGAIPDVNVDIKAAGLNLAVKTAQSVVKLPSHISAFPDPACEVTRKVADGVAGLKACGDQGTASGTLVAGKIDERASDICREATNEKTPPARAKTASVICEVRSRAAQLARSLQKDARNVEGWKLFAPLQKGYEEDSEGDAMSLGREEGVKIGYAFFALSPKRERLAYFKVVHVGPGGEKGIKNTTGLNRRFGEAPLGARLEEYPQIGISLMPFGGMMLLTQNYGRSTNPEARGTSVYELPAVAFGGGAHVSYDLSAHLGLVETYLRIGGGYYAGTGANTSVSLIPIEAALEKGFYLGKSLTWYAAAGGGTTMVNVKVTSTRVGGTEQNLSGSASGALARTGLDFMLSPDASLRLDISARYNFSPVEYKDEEDNPPANGWEKRKDHFSTLAASAAFGWTF